VYRALDVVSGRMAATLPLPFDARSFRPSIAEKSFVRLVAEIEADEPELELEDELDPLVLPLLLPLLLQPAMSRAATPVTTGIAAKAPLPDLSRTRRAAGLMDTSHITDLREAMNSHLYTSPSCDSDSPMYAELTQIACREI